MARLPSPAVVQTALHSLEQTPVGRQIAEWERQRQVPILFSNLLGGPGGAAWFGHFVAFPAYMQHSLEPDRLAHELVHCQQGWYIFGCLAHEREAYLVQYRILLENETDPGRRQYFQGVLDKLSRGGDAAYEWIKTQGPYYKTFPVENPRLWEVRKWWPQVAYALSVIIPRLQDRMRR